MPIAIFRGVGGSNKLFQQLADRSITTVKESDLSGVTSIGANAFANCTGLSEIRLPNTITSIGANAFANCTGLSVYLEGETPPSLGANIFQNSDFTVFVPYAAIGVYASGSSWSAFVNNIIGYMNAGAMPVGSTLPTTDSAGNDLTWYSDITMQTVVTEVLSATDPYYCAITNIVYGVDGVGSETPTLTRTDLSVGLGYTVNASTIDSDFDNVYPYSAMQEVTDENDNVFIRIPKFYSKITKNEDGTYKHQISPKKYAGFDTYFKDGDGNEYDYIDIGKYEASGSATQAYSKSGQTVLVNVNIVQMRTACRANGTGYQQFDLRCNLILLQLFWIEFATTNCQVIMRGYVDGNSAAVQTGRTDGVTTASGSEVSNTDGKHACKYRGVENPWGNVSKWTDGINFQSTSIYICESPTQYASNVYADPYSYVGDRPTTSSVELKTISYFDGSLFGFASETSTNANFNTYYCDGYYYAASGTVLFCGGSWVSASSAGLSLWYGNRTASYTSAGFGGRLIKYPS